MGKIKTILFADMPIHSVKFIKILTLRFIPRILRTRPSFLIPRKDSNIILRSRSKSRKSKRFHTTGTLFKRPLGVLLLAKARPERPRSPEDTAPRGTSASKATKSQKVEIPAVTGLEDVDFRNSSQERDDIKTEQDNVIPIPKAGSMDKNWKISVQKAFADSTRTKAPCEIPVHKAITLCQTINKKGFKSFQKELRAKNPTIPQIVIENVVSIFAQSGKINFQQACDEMLWFLCTNSF